MKLTYVVHANMPPNVWAHTVQIISMCKAFAENGVDTTLVVPRRNLPKEVDPFVYYGIPKIFSIVQVPCIDIYQTSTSVFVYWLRLISFYISARLYIWKNPSDIIYTRDLYATLFFPNAVVERHSFSQKAGMLNRLMFRLARKIVVLTSFIKERVVRLGIPSDKVHIAPDGVDLSMFSGVQKDIVIPKSVADACVVLGYIGTLKTMGMEKGVDDCIRSLMVLPEDYVLLVVGGESVDIDFYKKKAEECGVSTRVYFIGKVPHQNISAYIQMCAILLAPFPENEHYSFFMSPLKIFEYMASKKPIISTTLPSIQEVLKHEHNALLIPPSDPKALAQAIERLSADKVLAERISTQAYKDVVESYTWDKRAKKIIDFILS